MTYDVIVIGARCAGSPLAAILAKRGYRVLLLDRARFPSDKALSTHGIFRPGCAVIQRLGLLGKVIESNCPPIREFMLDLGPVTGSLQAPDVDGVDAMYAPRRKVLDTILAEGAAAAGAELREGFMVTDVLRKGRRIDDPVIGIRGYDIDSQTPVDEHAPIVVGADGVHSLVARTTQTEKYEEKPLRTGVYWSYWEGVPLDTGVQLHIRPGRFLPAISTNDGLTLIMDYFPAESFQEFKSDIERNFYTDWKTHVPEMYERIMEGKRVDRWIGTGFQPNFFRKPWGKGWALVGDADIHHDSANPSGITYALVNAELLANAIDDGLSERRPMDEALADYEARRKARWLPHYHFLTELSRLDAPPPPEMQALLGEIVQNPKTLGRKFMGLMEGHEDCLELADPARLQQLVSEGG